MKSYFIALLGPVGVGKSSTINILTQILNRKKLKSYKLLIKAFHGPSYLLWYTIVGLLCLPKDYAPWYVIPRSGYKDLARFLMILSAYIDALLTIPIRIILVRFLKLIGYTVISEEYLHTSLFGYLYSYLDLKIKSTLYTMFALHVLYSLALRYRPDIVIVLDADLREILKRWRQRGYGDPQLKYIMIQRRFLLQRYFYGDIIINTSNMCLAETIMTIIRVLNKLQLRVV